MHLKGVHRMIRTYSQMLRTGKYSRHSSIIWSVWLIGWVFVYELKDYGFESRCCQVIFRYHTCFEQGVPWYSGNCRVRIHSETPMWHDKNIQSFFLYSGELLLIIIFIHDYWYDFFVIIIIYFIIITYIIALLFLFLLLFYFCYV